MHEFAVCQGLLSQVEAVAAERQASAVTWIKVSVGPLSGVEPTLLKQAFHVARTGTVAKAAALEVEVLPVRVACRTCGACSDVPVNRLLCAACGDFRTRLVSGDELLLASLALETGARETGALETGQDAKTPAVN